ncbi:MAG TPA: hypothetical protein VM779_14045 [Thermoanaerobaculia bacterium]|nr:hypothetical protein [Thermoanaerobaculia bacterium]
MSSSYEASFRKVAPLEDVAPGTERVFRAAGVTIVVRRDGERVTATDRTTRTPLAVRLEDGAIWVCVEECRP